MAFRVRTLFLSLVEAGLEVEGREERGGRDIGQGNGVYWGSWSGVGGYVGVHQHKGS